MEKNGKDVSLCEGLIVGLVSRLKAVCVAMWEKKFKTKRRLYKTVCTALS